MRKIKVLGRYVLYFIPIGQFGFTKWEIYGVPPSVARVAYHDDIKIFGK